MARKKKTEETPEIKEVKKDPVKVNPYGWTALRNKAKFTKVK